ncbi:MAG: hypothetical protein IAE82_15100, partial [Opitutaceae bacterium]|nr:hypothetical protein [Opitutaceae bacterium]
QHANPGDVLAGFEDVARILEAMRAEGLSPEIRYMAGSMIVLQRLFAERRHMLFGEVRYTWQYGVSGGNLPREKMAAGREHTLKRDDIMLALMGDDYLIGRFPDSMVSGPRFGGLPPEKVRQVLLIETDYSAAKALTMGQGSMDSAHATAVRVAGDKDADIRAILTPEEYERYQAATAPAMYLLRRGLAGADVDDAQFAAISRRARAADPLGTGSSNETLAPFVEIILAEAGPKAALTYARTMDRSQPSALVVLESAGLEAGEIARRYLVLQAYRTPPQDTSRAAADYEAVTAGLSDEQRTALERSSAGSRLKRAANAKRRTP